MFAILVPAALGPLIGTLLWAEHKAEKLGIVAEALRRGNQPVEATAHKSFAQKVIGTAGKLDVVGLLLIGASVALFLLPLTLARNAKGGWSNRQFIALITTPALLLRFVCPCSIHDSNAGGRHCANPCLRRLGLQVCEAPGCRA